MPAALPSVCPQPKFPAKYKVLQECKVIASHATGSRQSYIAAAEGFASNVQGRTQQNNIEATIDLLQKSNIYLHFLLLVDDQYCPENVGSQFLDYFIAY